MSLNKISIIAYLCFISTSKMSPISRPSLVNRENSKVMFFIDSEIKITKYEIFESKIHSNSYRLLRSSHDIDLRDKLRRNVLVIDISDIDKNVNKEYKIHITTDKNELYKSESFVWHGKTQMFKLTNHV